MLKNVHPVILASFLLTDENVFTLTTPNTHRMTDYTHNQEEWGVVACIITFSVEIYQSVGEMILKIGQHLTKLEAKI